MTGDQVRTRQFYVRRAKTADARCRVCDTAVGPERRRLVVCSGGGIKTSDIVVGRDKSDMLQHCDRDRISNLPQDLILCILNRLSIHDAATTSVLAKEWRYLWGNNTQLVLDKSFFSQLTSNKEKDANQFVFLRALERIFSSHIGRIFGFNLYIPPDIDPCPVARWIEHFLKKGIRYLMLDNSENKACEIPSCLFDCAELISLALNTWIWSTPHKCTSFTNLIWVELVNISFSADISFGTRLKHLRLINCTGIKHLGCQFTNGNSLTNVFLAVSEQIDWRWFKCTPQLRVLGLVFISPATINMKNPINFIKLLSNLPSLKTVKTSGFTLQVWRPELSVVMNRCATKVQNLKDLFLHPLGSYNFRQILNTLHLMRCLPNLQSLVITLVNDKSFYNPRDLTAVNLDLIDWKDMLLGELHTVLIQGAVASNYVFYFLKLLLTSSPSLERMLVICSSEVTDPCEKLEIKQKLTRFPKRSSTAEVYFKEATTPVNFM